LIDNSFISILCCIKGEEEGEESKGSLIHLKEIQSGEGLKCNRCVGKGCRNTVETCRIDHNTCGTVLFKPPLPILYFKRCMKMSECLMLGSNKDIDAFCCTTNQCN
uniref:UPAR/Ly6 domain-containing protein n=1 Tax=Oncorhynchus tshawytscha TaxID=74940 RepID=A0AAZ3NRX0_ONCTS